MLRKGLFLFLLLFCLASLGAQSPASDDELIEAYQAIMANRMDDDRMTASDAFKAKLKTRLRKPDIMTHPFEGLQLGKMVAPDGRFRMFNWNVPNNDGTQHYEAILVVPKGKTGMVDVIELNDTSAEMDRPSTRSLKGDSWYGALYFDIIPFKRGGGDHYLLLGWDGKDAITNEKVIEVLSLSGKQVRFGAPVFKRDEKRMLDKRLFFTYAEQISMSMLYQEKQERVVFDHLAPREAHLEGQYQFYGPDMSFDALEYKRGKWLWQSNVEFLRKRSKKDRDFIDPRTN